MAAEFDTLKCIISADGMAADIVAAEGAVAHGPLLEQACLALLAQHGVACTPEVNEKTQELVQMVRSAPEHAHRLVVAHGTPVRHGTDGYLEWLPGFDPCVPLAGQDDGCRAVDGAVDRDGVVDHYARSDLVIVRTGQAIARLIKPVEGVAGVTVTGDDLQPRIAKPVAIRYNESVELRSDCLLYAAVDGIVSWNAGSLCVRQELEIHSDVDFTTGNVVFPGTVTVHRGIRDRFVVNAGRDLVVFGLVEAATVTASGDMELLGGMAAREKGTLMVGRDLAVRYMENVNGAVSGDMRVDRDLLHSEILVGGRLKTSASSVLLGGCVTVAGACELGELGATGGASTLLVLGRLGDTEALLARAVQAAETVGQHRNRGQSEYERLSAYAAKLTPAQAERVTELQFQIATYDALAARLEASQEALQSIVNKRTTVDLVVQKMIHEGVRVRFGTLTATFRQSVKGPVRLSLDNGGTPILTDSDGRESPLGRVAEIVCASGEAQDVPGQAA